MHLPHLEARGKHQQLRSSCACLPMQRQLVEHGPLHARRLNERSQAASDKVPHIQETCSPADLHYFCACTGMSVPALY